MNKPIQFQKETVLNIGIHLTPKIGRGHKISDFICNHSTQLTCQFNVLRGVTQLHRGGVCEN